MNGLIVFGAQYLFILPLLIVIGVWVTNSPHDRYLLLIRTLIATALAVWLVTLTSAHFPETRPYLARHLDALITNPPTDNSFPSDHTTLSFTAALLVLPFSPILGAISLVLAGLVAVARVLALLHWPVDVLGGIGIAVISAGVAYLFFPGERKKKD